MFQIRVYFFIFVSKRENCICPLLKHPRDPRTVVVLWFISRTAQSEVQRGDICFAFVQEISRVLFMFAHLFCLLKTSHF